MIDFIRRYVIVIVIIFVITVKTTVAHDGFEVNNANNTVCTLMHAIVIILLNEK